MPSRRALDHRSRRPNPRHSLAVVAVGVLAGFTACGGDADTTSIPPVEEASADADEIATPTAVTDAGEVDATTSGSGSGTLALNDGTIHTFVMSTCETSENGADGFVLPDSYDLFGATADGEYRLQLIHAGLDEDSVFETADLEGEFDEDGKNAGLIYTKVVDTLALTVDGGNVAGTVTLHPIGPNRPYGDEVEATVAVTC